MRKTAWAVCLAALCMFCFVGCGSCAEEKEPQYASSLSVTVEGGIVRGKASEDGKTAIFKGIPYAAPPTGELRWKAPRPVKAWEGELDCTLWGANALQGDATVFSYWTEEFVQDTDPTHYRDGIVYSEDCLTLNVWSSYAVTKDKPVLVFIHGGGYNSGGAPCEIYDGENLALEDVVFVSIQYRVGALGYLATEALISEEENSGAGNYGLLDQIAALKWVQNNIGEFGGDPSNVTVFGQSAGSGSVNALIASPLAKGLFKRAVAASHNAIYRDWKTVKEKCAQLNLTYNGKSYAAMSAEELRAIPSSELKGKTVSPAGPCIDGYVLTDTYKNTVLKGKANDAELMIGNVARDDLISSVYTDSSVTAVDSMLALLNAASRARIAGGCEQNTYLYMFEHDVPRSTSGSDDPFGAKHSYELAYFFGNFSTASGRQWRQVDRDLSAAMMSYLVGFCKNGNPAADVGQWTNNIGGYNYMRFAGGAEEKEMDETKTAKVNEHYGFDF